LEILLILFTNMFRTNYTAKVVFLKYPISFIFTCQIKTKLKTTGLRRIIKADSSETKYFTIY